MTKTMTLEQQIDEARAALEELTTDEAELSRLQADQAAEIDALKAAGSRDFAGLATLEGKRAALASMLSEQRASIAQAQARISGMEAQNARAEGLNALRDRVASLRARRAKVDTLVASMADSLAAHLADITSERLAWHDELTQARDEAAALFDLYPLVNISYSGDTQQSNARTGWAAAFDELGEGARLAFTTSAAARQIGGLMQDYQPPKQPHPEVTSIERARRPLLSYFDRPINLTLAHVFATADDAMPELLKAREVR